MRPEPLNCPLLTGGNDGHSMTEMDKHVNIKPQPIRYLVHYMAEMDTNMLINIKQ